MYKVLENDKELYFRVYFRSKFVSNDVCPNVAFVRAISEIDAKRIMEEIMDTRDYEVVAVTSAKKHMITRDSLVINCYDVIAELEKNYVF